MVERFNYSPERERETIAIVYWGESLVAYQSDHVSVAGRRLTGSGT